MADEGALANGYQMLEELGSELSLKYSRQIDAF